MVAAPKGARIGCARAGRFEVRRLPCRRMLRPGAGPVISSGALEGRLAREAMCERILAHMEQGRTYTARSLAAALGEAKGTVNSVLYGSPQFFVQTGGEPPQWQLRDHVALPPTPQSSAVPDRLEVRDELYPWQRSAVAAWVSRGRRGVVEAVTGAGKTRMALAAIEEALAAGRRVAVIVPTTVLLEQWHQSLRLFQGVRVGGLGGGRADSLSTHDIVVATVQSAHRVERLLPPNSQGLLVADEVHRYGTESFARVLQPDFDWRLGMTATFERNDDGLVHHLDPYFGGVIYRLGYRQALNEGVIAPFRVALFRMALTRWEQEAYDASHSAALKARIRLINEFGVTREPFGEFMAEVAALAERGSPRDPATRTARVYLSSFTKSRRILGETRVKLEALKHLSSAVSASRGTLVFTSTVRGARAAADVLEAAGVSAAVIDSTMPMRDRRHALSRFDRGEVAAVAAPLVLDEGVDVPDADLAVILAASKTRRQMIQRLGRVVRKKDGNRRAHLALLVAANTSEDPTSGAHLGFITEMLAVAEDLRVFDVSNLREAELFLQGGISGRPFERAKPTNVVALKMPSTGNLRLRGEQLHEDEDLLRSLGAQLHRRPTTTIRLERLFGLPRDVILRVLNASPDYVKRNGRWYPVSEAPPLPPPAPPPPPSVDPRQRGTSLLTSAWEEANGPLVGDEERQFLRTIQNVAPSIDSASEARRFVEINRGFIIGRIRNP